MDKFDRLFDLVEHPERYSDEQLYEMLSDPETREAYDLMCKMTDAFVPVDDVDIDAEWRAFERKHIGSRSLFIAFFSRHAAAVIIGVVATFAAFAAGIGVSISLHRDEPSHVVGEEVAAAEQPVHHQEINQKKQFDIRAIDPTHAFLKAQYDALTFYPDPQYNSCKREILLVGKNRSQFYNAQTYFIDSLRQTASGKAVFDAMQREAEEQWRNGGKLPFYYMREHGFGSEDAYANDKDFASKSITVLNSSMGDKYRYTVDMDDLDWTICDSTKQVLGYECFLAEADYHGRHWLAWFTPEIPVHDGPWQLCGLPGLIMEAVTADGAYAFMITGLQHANELFKPDFHADKRYDIKRAGFYKMKDYSSKNREALVNIRTNGHVKLVRSQFIDDFGYIELDYKE